MSSIAETLSGLSGLSSASIPQLQAQFGKNEFSQQNPHRLRRLLLSLITEPMSILLIIACCLYFVLGNNAEGIMMLVAITIVSAIGLYQELRSSKALQALQQLTSPEVRVVRDGRQILIHSGELVPGDIMFLEEGRRIPADGAILQANDFTVNESVLTGESVPVIKTSSNNKELYQGTLVNSGSCLAVVTATGTRTRLAEIGQLIEAHERNKTVLQTQMARLVNRLALFGLLAFAVIFFINFIRYGEFATSLLFALTLAMSAIPEEIPVAFSSFMALGAYKMSKLGIISRQAQIIENLGSMDVICFDKTGTVTENKMVVRSIYNFRSAQICLAEENFPGCGRLLLYAVLACESQPFDSMEKAIVDAYLKSAGPSSARPMQMIHEYLLDGIAPMMTHVYRSNNEIIVAAKGAPERILDVCRVTGTDRKKTEQLFATMGSQGFRILGVASAAHTGELPAQQDDFAWQFEGLLALYDPPKKNIPEVISGLYDAKVQVKLITGDYAETAIAIAQQAGIRHPEFCYSGEQVMQMSNDELRPVVNNVNVFARMFPQAKLKVVKCLRENGHTVGMTGDGVNDAPALKAADIGIAMGNKGTEMAQQASDLVIINDDLNKITVAISEGRRIYHNLLKAVRYIITIHIPIILTASIPVILGWKFPNIFTPIHVIFLELIMGPTCSVFFEKEPVEHSSIEKEPRKRNEPLLKPGTLLISIMQGIVIAAGVLLLYYFAMRSNHSLEETRSLVFTTLIIANVFLTFSSRSFTQNILTTTRYKNSLALPVLAASVIFLCLLLLYPPVRHLFGLTAISFAEFGICFSVAFFSVFWFEVYKTNLPQPLSVFRGMHVHKEHL